MPEGTLVADPNTNVDAFLGTTYQSRDLANNSAGTVFLYAGGSYSVLHTFCSEGGSSCIDGINPVAGVVLGTDGNLYGTAIYGGNNNVPGGGGTIFKIALPSGSFSVLYTFCSQGGANCTDGAGPYGGLIQASDGNFYGTTEWGGPYASGTIFEITPGGSFTSLYSFCSKPSCADGGGPFAGLVQGTDGNLYGTTFYDNAYCVSGVPCGTVFKYSFVPIANVSPQVLTFPAQDVGTTSAPGSSPWVIAVGRRWQ